MIDDELNSLMTSRRSHRLLGMITSDRWSSGGSMWTKHLRELIYCGNLGEEIRNFGFLDFGCGIGNPVVMVKERWPGKLCVGVDFDEVRMNFLRRRLAVRDLLDNKMFTIVTNWCETWSNDEAWEFMRLTRFVIYFNNFNMDGEVNEYAQKLILRQASLGSVVIAYSPLFTVDRQGLVVDCREVEMELDYTHFTWMSASKKVVKVYIYRVLDNVQ